MADRWRLFSWDDKRNPSRILPSTKNCMNLQDKTTLAQMGGGGPGLQTNWEQCAVPGTGPDRVMENSTGSFRVRLNAKGDDSDTPAPKVEIGFTNNGGAGWQWLHECEGVESVDDQIAYTYNKYNRMVLWVKPPASLPHNYNGQNGADYYAKCYSAQSFNLGTYQRATYCNHVGPDEQTSQASHARDTLKEWSCIDYRGQQLSGHPYHRFSWLVPGKWNQVILDWHMTHTRGHTDVVNVSMPYPFKSNTYHENEGDNVNDSRNYFDSLTPIYFHGFYSQKIISQFPCIGGLGHEWYFDSMEFYEEPYPQDVIATDAVAGLTGAFDQENNRLHVGFSVIKKSEYYVDMAYSFSDVHAMTPSSGDKWNNAGVISFTANNDGLLPVPSQMQYNYTTDHGVLNPHNGDYPCRHLWTEEIDVTGQEFLYVVLRPVKAMWDIWAQGASPPFTPGTWDLDNFRQICIPLTDGKLPPHLKD